TEPLMDSERGLLGLLPLPSPLAGALVALAGGTATPLLDLGAPPGAKLSTPPGTVWVLAESAYGREKGGRTALNDTAVASGDRGALELEPGASIAIARVEIGREEEFRKEQTTKEMSMIDTETDARVMRVKYARGSGKRHRDWREVQDGIAEVPLVDLPIEGPRTSSWCVAFLGRGAHGGTPLDHHRWWRHAAKLKAGDWGVAEHESVMKSLTYAGSYDQLDLANLACIEHLCRRARLIEYYHREKIRGADRNALGKNALPFDEQEMFMGEGRGGRRLGATLGARGLTTPAQLRRSSALAEGRDRGEFSLSPPPRRWMLGYRALELDADIVKFAARWESSLALVANRVVDMSEPPKGLSSSAAFNEVVKSADYHATPPLLYANLVEALFKRGLIDFGTDVRCECGVSGAWKESGKQRMVIDARLSNAHFGHSKETPPPTAAAFSEIDLEGEAEAWFAALDLKDAFYYIELPIQLLCYFGLPKVSVKKLGLPKDVLGLAVDGRLQPRFAAMPMGWTRALYWAQPAHCRILTRAFPDFEVEGFLADNRVLPSVEKGVIGLCVDNFVAVGHSAEAANPLVARAADAFRRAGLQPHEEVAATQELELLGWQLRGGKQAGAQATDRRRR
ncbi:unnamed protein product, partial [Prorocentrum cordatum]